MSPLIFARISGGIAAVGLIIVALGLHSHAIKAAHDQAFADGRAQATSEYTAAQARADKTALSAVAVTVKKQAAISEGTTNDFHRSIAGIDARADALRVRHDAAARPDHRAPGDMPAPGTVAAGACPAPAEGGLPWAVALPALTQAAKDLAQLNAVLDWEAKQDALATAP